MCVAESQKRRILIYDGSPDGKIGKGRLLIELPAATQGIIEGGEFLPGGFVFDTKGRLYVAMGIGGGIDVFQVPSVKRVRQYEAGGRGATTGWGSSPPSASRTARWSRPPWKLRRASTLSIVP